MDFSANIDLIIRELNEVSEIIDDLRQYPDVPAIQLEIARSKCRLASDVISLLKNMPVQASGATVRATPLTPPAIRPETPELRKSEMTVPEVIVTDKKPEAQPVVSAPEPKEVKEPEPVKPLTKTEVPITAAVDVKKSPASVTADIRTTTDEKPSVADMFSTSSKSLGEQIGKGKENGDLQAAISSRPIPSLSDAIGLNDKFLFIGQIFNGNKEDYSNTINSLDRAPDYHEACSILSRYTGNSPETEAVKQLLSLVKRKFPTNE